MRNEEVKEKERKKKRWIEVKIREERNTNQQTKEKIII